MKKVLLAFLMAGASLPALAQRLSLYEEFSGENCAPCAVANPGLWTLMNTGTNPSKILLIKYQSPIPSAGPIYLAYTTVTDNRIKYYTVPSAPYGRLNGSKVGSGTGGGASGVGHVSNLLQKDIDDEATAGSPFKVGVTAVYNGPGDSITTTVTVTCVTAYAPASANMKLRVGMIEHLIYDVAPGTNGEKEFHNVVREMYPDANGTTIPNAWAAGDTKTYVLKGKVRSFVKKANAPQMVAWLQNETDKNIPQASVSAPMPKTFATNLTASGINTAKDINCSGSTVTGATVTLKNSGTTTASAATVYYRIGGGTWGSQPWTGSLAAGASTTVTLGAITIPATATTSMYLLQDSVVFAGDQDVLDNVNSSIYHLANTSAQPLPISTDFEGKTFPAGYMMTDLGGKGTSWGAYNMSPGKGHSGQNGLLYFLYSYASGSTGLLVVPTPKIDGKVSMDFWESYAQQSSSDNDKLEVVYSTDCGSSWVPMWSATGSAHATRAPLPVSASADIWIPRATADWVKRSVDISSLPANAILALRATAGGGNMLWVDDVNIRAGLNVTESAEIVNNITLGPNPASAAANISFNLVSGSKVQVVLVDVMGKVVSQVADENMSSGNHQLTINTAALAAGVYMVKINTDKGSVTERLSVVK